MKAMLEDGKKIKSLIKEHGYHHSLLIDFKYAYMVSMGMQGVSSSDHTVSIETLHPVR
jgi:hypothetical protein